MAMGKLQGSSWDSIFTFSHGMEFFILPIRSVSKIVFLNFSHVFLFWLHANVICYLYGCYSHSGSGFFTTSNVSIFNEVSKTKKPWKNIYELGLGFIFVQNKPWTQICTMLQKLSKCEVKAWLCFDLIILPPLQFYVKSNFSEFKLSKNFIFGTFRDSEILIFGEFGT